MAEGDWMDRFADRLTSVIGTVWYNSPAILAAAGAILLAVPGRGGLWFWLGVGLSLAALVLSLVFAPRVKELVDSRRKAQDQSRRRSQALGAVMDIVLMHLMDEMGIDVSRGRATVYGHLEGQFVMLARSSASQKLKAAGRSSYPEDEGVIGKAWDQGTAYAFDLPSTDGRWKQACQRDWAMSAESVAAVKMRSCSLVGVRIDADGPSRSPVGLIVVESLDQQGVSAEQVDDLSRLQSWELTRRVLHEVVASHEGVKV